MALKFNPMLAHSTLMASRAQLECASPNYIANISCGYLARRAEADCLHAKGDLAWNAY